MKDRPKMYSWDDRLDTGIEIVDEQHRKFLTHANQFILKVLTGKVKEGVEEEYDFLKQYLLYHFQTEETFQFDSHYPQYKEHQAEHLQLKFKAKELEVAMSDCTEEEVVDKFCTFIETWVMNHIMVSDLKFALYYKEWKKLGDWWEEQKAGF